MRIQTKAAGVLERTSHYLKAGLLREKPVWFNVVGSHPPNSDFTKKPKLLQNNLQSKDPQESLYTASANLETGHYKTRVNKQDRQHVHKTVTKIPKLEFLEDQLRDVFYHQHPWEFSRPKVLVEGNEANEYQKCDWSHMLQLEKPLDGESVVQRTLWLLKRDKSTTTLFEAYDKARFEFYRLRMEEEMSSTVAREEAQMLGTIFPTTNLSWGVEQEQKFADVWAKAAAEQTQIFEAKSSSGGRANGSMGGENVAEESKSVWEAQEEKK